MSLTPWPGTAPDAAKDINPIIPELFIKCFHDYSATEELSSFIFPSSMNGLKGSTKIESHTLPSHGIMSDRRLDAQAVNYIWNIPADSRTNVIKLR